MPETRQGENMADLLRRQFLAGAGGIGAALGVAASAGAASFGNPDNPAEDRINGKSPSSLSDPGVLKKRAFRRPACLATSNSGSTCARDSS
jgi:hypothetical protein